MTPETRVVISDICHELIDEYFKLEAVIYGIDCINMDTAVLPPGDLLSGFVYIAKGISSNIHGLHERLDQGC